MSSASATPDLPTFDLRLSLRPREGAVLRTIGLMERRGFRLLSCTVAEAPPAIQGEAAPQGQPMEARVVSDRDPKLLLRQLERLHDVLHAELADEGGELQAISPRPQLTAAS